MVNTIALVLVIIGAINWALIGVFQFDLVAWIFGSQAAVWSAVTKLFGVHGVFYKVCGKGVGGIDGFYERSSFDLYHEMALINPEHPNELCEELSRETGIPVVLMDANDLQRDQLGKSSTVPLTDEQIQDAMADNPSGQGDELTPFILIRPQQG